MSLAINPSLIVELLLADGWHHVYGSSFDIDSYEYLDDDGLVLYGGGTGFTFIECAVVGLEDWQGEPGLKISGSLTAILAVKEKR
jgi:hypothetical protein